jgi:16S rRNA processing protein RimM
LLLEVGHITKPHGVRGDVLVKLTSDRTSRLDPGSVLVTGRGPLTVVQSSLHNDRWIVTFDEIDGRDDAEGWRGTLLQAEASDDPADGDPDGDGFWVHQLVGATVVLVDGTEVGVVREVEANPASDLLVLESGTLVPVVFVVEQVPGRVTIDPPEGLLEL